MTDKSLALEEFEALVQPLLGLKVSLPWKGYSTAIFLELGQLAPLENERQRYNDGEACISIEWDWRVECGTSVLYGSSNSSPEIVRGIHSLLNASIQALSLERVGPELAVQFSNGHCLRSSIMFNGDPRWDICLPGGQYLYARDGLLALGEGIRRLDEDAAEAEAHAEKTAARWGVPDAAPAHCQCSKCEAFVRINGDYNFLDYGVCTEGSSPFDGKVVSCKSGCPAFTKLGFRHWR